MKTILEGKTRSTQLRRGIVGWLLCWSLAVPASSQSQLPEGKGKAIVETACAQCHGLNNITNARYSLAEWKNVVYDMVSQGAPLMDDEIEEVAQYLAENFGKAKAPQPASESKPSEKINVNEATAEKLRTSLELSQEEAQAVVQYREKNGRFGRWEDLKKVSGLDIRKIEPQKDRLIF